MTVSITGDELRELVELVRQGADANGRPDLLRRMRAAADATPAEAAASVLRALDSLEVDLRLRRAALCDPGRGSRLAAESRHAETALRRFQDNTTTWSRTVGDALSATDSDLEYAVQNRLRSLLDDGTAVIESAGLRGDDLDRWLHERMIAELTECHRALRTAADAVAGRIAGTLELPGPAPSVALALEAPADLVAQLHKRRPAAPDRQPLSTKLLGIIMPTYSGMMVALVLPRIFGLQLKLWLILVVAVIGACGMGGAALAGERQRNVSRRNAETVGDLRSVLDAFRMAVSKQVRDGVREIGRQLYATVGDAVDTRSRRLSGEAGAARDALAEHRRTEESLTDIDGDLESVRELQERARRFLTD
ncbi:MAG: hypothetical protein ABW046_09575 [Actinoplanes sp.]